MYCVHASAFGYSAGSLALKQFVSRDPFARTTLYRLRVYGGRRCDWCGQAKRPPSGRPYLYQYSTESDGGRSHVHRGLFCDKSCHDSYLT